MKPLILFAFASLFILPSCYKVSYSCNQILVENEQETQIEHVDFGERKRQWEDFSDTVAGDTTHINDSTYLFWECFGAK